MAKKKDDYLPPRKEEFPELLKISAVASILGISRTKAYEIVRRKRIPSHNIDGALRVPKHEIKAYLKRTAS